MLLNKRFSLLFIATLCILAFISFRPASQNQVSNEGIGDVVYSLLSPDLFKKVHNGQWMLLDGSPLEDSSNLKKFLSTNNVTDILHSADGIPGRLPDARGVFLRGMNAGQKSTLGDADGDRKVGAYQRDSLKSHNHTYLKPYYTRSNGEGLDDDEKFNWEEVNTSSFGGSETRPRNIALYIYVKVGN